MYRKASDGQLEFEDFYLPFGGKLRSDNRWVILSKMIPWRLIEELYATQFSAQGKGPPAMSARIAFGALIIRERLGVTDREAVAQIGENPYLQFFLGFHEFRDQPPFDASMYVHFRKRFSLEQLSQINEAIVQAEQKARIVDDSDKKQQESPGDDDDQGRDRDDDSGTPPPSNKGQLLVDATCAPADIRYPTDVSLLNEAREKTEEIIDTLFAPLRGQQKKPRTYRQKARRAYLSYSKKRQRSAAKRRKAIGQQLGFLRRNLDIIAQLNEDSSLTLLSRYQYRCLLVIQELYRQQQWMYQHRTCRITGRIVSISQPHVRPIVRGKASSPTEFGAKLSASLVDGFSFLDRLDWDPYNESGDLIRQIETYRQRNGCYPQSVHCDAIYRTRKNRTFCKSHGIRMSGPALGRPAKKTAENAQQLKDKKEQQRQDERDRIAIEGRFGQAKRRFGLGCIMAKLQQTSEAVMGLIFIVMNLEKWLQKYLGSLFDVCRQLRRAIGALTATVLSDTWAKSIARGKTDLGYHHGQPVCCG